MCWYLFILKVEVVFVFQKIFMSVFVSNHIQYNSYLFSYPNHSYMFSYPKKKRMWDDNYPYVSIPFSSLSSAVSRLTATLVTVTKVTVGQKRKT